MTTHAIINELDDLRYLKCYSITNAENCCNLIKQHNLKILTLNIRSVNHNFSDFLVLLTRINLDIDIIILTECWINDNSIIAQMNGYIQFNSTKYVNKAGGVIAYVRDNLSPQCKEPNLCESNCLAIEIKGCITVLAIYRSPSFKQLDLFTDSLYNVITSIDKQPCFVLTGDINLNILEGVSHSADITEYLCMMSELGFLSAVDKPTRKDALLDHVFVKGRTEVETVVIASSIIDHSTVITGITTESPNPTKIKSVKIRYNH